MKLPTLLLRVLSLSLATLATASTPSPESSTKATAAPASITLRIPSTNALPNPFVLPPSTHATITTRGEKKTAWLSTSNTFIFRDLPPGSSYLIDIYCVTHAFAPLRLDVDKEGRVQLWETYRGNDWANKGEAIRSVEGNGIYDVRVVGTKGYFLERAKFNFFSILRNPMVLLGLVSMGIFIGMPYLVDNMDPEMRAEWEERQKSNPMNGIMGAATGQGGSATGNFDMAAFLAGSTKKDESSSNSGAITAGSGGSETPGKGSSSKGGKKGR